MDANANNRWLIARRPVKRPVVREDFAWEPERLQALPDGRVRVEVLALGLAPGIKGKLERIPGYSTEHQSGGVVPSEGIGRVVESRSVKYSPGDLVIAELGWQQYATLSDDELSPVPGGALPAYAYLGPLGVTGLTAYFGLFRVGRPEAGETLVVSGASGAVGSIVCQLGKIAGCRVIGVSRGAQKCAWLMDELKLDGVIDLSLTSAKAALSQLAPRGVDIFFDNIGGDLLGDVLARLAQRARVVVCGSASQYQNEGPPKGPSTYMNLVFRSARMEGFLLYDFEQEYELARARLADWLAKGEIVYRDHLVDGLENAPDALISLLQGLHFGKTILRVAPSAG